MSLLFSVLRLDKLEQSFKLIVHALSISVFLTEHESDMRSLLLMSPNLVLTTGLPLDAEGPNKESLLFMDNSSSDMSVKLGGETKFVTTSPPDGLHNSLFDELPTFVPFELAESVAIVFIICGIRFE